jgi:hypothetical protein
MRVPPFFSPARRRDCPMSEQEGVESKEHERFRGNDQVPARRWRRGVADIERERALKFGACATIDGELSARRAAGKPRL